MRRNEFSGRKLSARLTASRSHVPVFRFAVPQLSDHRIVAIENAHLTIQIRAHRPLALGVEVAWHSHVLLVFDCLQMDAVKGEGLNSSVTAVSHGENRHLSTKIDP